MSQIRKWDEVNGDTDSAERLVAFVENTNDSYAILQLKHIKETDYERFKSFSSLKRQGKEPDFDHYEVIYTGSLPTVGGDAAFICENLYERFNVNHPADFTGHSLSISDVVALKINGSVSCHYVDRVGFKELENFITRKDEPEKRPSMLEQLREISGNNGLSFEPIDKEREL